MKPTISVTDVKSKAALLIAKRDDLHLRLRNGKSNGPLEVPQPRDGRNSIDWTSRGILASWDCLGSFQMESDVPWHISK